MELDRRSNTILQLIVEAYIRNAQPVSSAALLKAHPALKLSSATVRAIMVELTHAGLLRQPHTSSGRVPTEPGLRTYLDNLVSPKLRPWDRNRLDAAGQSDAAAFPGVMGETLSGLSGQMVVGALPRFLGSHLREVGLVRCGPRRVLAYCVSPSGLVQQKVIPMDDDLSQSELTEVQNYLNAHLAGRSLSELRNMVTAELRDARAESDLLRKRALGVSAQLVPPAGEGAWELHVQGASHLAEQPEFNDLTKLRTLLRSIEQREALLRLLDRIVDTAGVMVMLGSEHRLRDMPDVACVGAAWSSETGARSAIGVLGPSRMDYGRLVPLVAYATQLFGRFWERI